MIFSENETRKRRLMIAVLLIAGGIVTGCTAEQIAQIKQDVAALKGEVTTAQEVINNAIEEKAKIDKQIAEMEPGAERDYLIAVSEDYQKVIDNGRKWVDWAGVRLSELETQLAEAQNEVDVFEAAGKTVSNTLPPPFNVYGLLGVTTVAAVWRAVKNRSAARNIAKSIDTIVATANDTQKAGIAANQTETAKRIVDEAQDKKLKLPI